MFINRLAITRHTRFYITYKYKVRKNKEINRYEIRLKNSRTLSLIFLEFTYNLFNLVSEIPTLFLDWGSLKNLFLTSFHFWK